MSGRGVTRFVNAKVCRDGVLVREDLWVADGTIVDAQSRFFNVRGSGCGWRAACANITAFLCHRRELGGVFSFFSVGYLVRD